MSGELIVVIGPTGSGKSAAAVALARRLNGEVINADAMQLYRGLDIANARIAIDEMKGIPHHLLGIYEPEDQKNVSDYLNACDAAIADIMGRGKTPILAGGTNLYIEHILFKNSVLAATTEILSTDSTTHNRVSFSSQEKSAIIKSLPFGGTNNTAASVESKTMIPENTVGEEVSLYDILARHDPETAEVMHPRDNRRIVKALDAMMTSGIKLSSARAIINNSLEDTSSSALTPVPLLRFPKLFVCRLTCKSDSIEPIHENYLDSVHNKRLAERVDSMVSSGLIEEIYEMHKRLKSNELYQKSIDQNYSSGITQTIGFKEFQPLFKALDCGHVALSNVSRPLPKELETLRLEGIEKMKGATRKYAKRQLTWIENRLEPLLCQCSIPVFYINSVHREEFNEQTCAVAEDICIRRKQKYSEIIYDSSVTNSTDRFERKRKIYECTDCGGPQKFQGLDQFNIHLMSKKHKKRIASKKRRNSLTKDSAISGIQATPGP